MIWWSVILLVQQSLLCHAIDTLGLSYFEMKDRNTVLSFCPEEESGIMFKLPPIPECTPIDLGEESQSVSMTTYWPHEGDHRFIGQECYADTYKKVVGKTFFGIFEPLESTVKIKTTKITREECVKMVASGKTPKGELMARIGPGLVGTDNHKKPKAGWISGDHVVNVNYYVADIRMAVSSELNLIKVVGALLKENCDVEQEYCPTEKGSLVWNKADHRTCRIMLGKTTTCLKTGQQITCPETLTTIKGWTETRMCGVSVAKGSSGVLFSSNNSKELHPNINSHTEIMAEIKILHGDRVNVSDLTHRGSATAAQTLMMNQFIMTTLNSKIDAVISNVHHTQCLTIRMMMIMHINDAKNGNLNGLLNALRGDNMYSGRLSGDLISAFKCHEVRKYSFVEPHPELCTIEHPIEYELLGKIRSGFLCPLTHSIVRVPTLIKCPALPFHFTTEDGTTINLRTKGVVKDISTLPNPALSVWEDSTPDSVFTPEVIWTGGEDTTDHVEDDVQAVINFMLMGQVIDDIMHGESPKSQAWDVMLKLLNWIMSGLIGYIIMGVILMAFVLMVAIRLNLLGQIIRTTNRIVSLLWKKCNEGFWFMFRAVTFIIMSWINAYRRIFGNRRRDDNAGFEIVSQSAANPYFVESKEVHTNRLPYYIPARKND